MGNLSLRPLRAASITPGGKLMDPASSGLSSNTSTAVAAACLSLTNLGGLV
jgi:hypothetical protein